MPEYSVTVLRAARDDLFECVAYLRGEEYERAAVRLIHTFEETVRDLSLFPKRGRKRPSERLGWDIYWLPLHKKSTYRLYYRITGSHVTVLHVRVGLRPIPDLG